MEMKHSIRSKVHIFSLIMTMIAFLLGYVLLIGVDHLKNLTIYDYLFSVYTVFTQFGTLLFSVVFIYYFNVDYKEKNILFYKSLHMNATKFFLGKFCVLLLWITVPICLGVFISCMVFHDFDSFINMFFYIENVGIYLLIIASLLGFLCKNMLVAYCINIFYWIASILLLSTFPNLSFLAFFDSSNLLYRKLNQEIQMGSIGGTGIFSGLLYNGILLMIIYFIVVIFRKAWVKHGI